MFVGLWLLKLMQESGKFTWYPENGLSPSLWFMLESTFSPSANLAALEFYPMLSVGQQPLEPLINGSLLLIIVFRAPSLSIKFPVANKSHE